MTKKQECSVITPKKKLQYVKPDIQTRTPRGQTTRQKQLKKELKARLEHAETKRLKDR